MKFQEIEFQKKMLRGFYYAADKNEIVIVFHGFMGNKSDHHGMLRLFCEDIHHCGFSAFRFDFLGSGDSDGTFYDEESMYSQLKQGKAVIEYFQQKGYKVHLFAFSMGAVLAARLAEQIKIASLFLLSPAGNFDEILSKMLHGGKKCIEGWEINGFHISDAFLEEAKAFPYFREIGRYEGPVHLVQGSADQYVSQKSFETYCHLYKQLRAVWIKEADHCFSTLAATNEVRKEIRFFYGKIKNMADKKQ